MQQLLKNLWNEETGQGMVEYSLLLGFFALSGAAVLTGMRNVVVAIWQSIISSFVGAAS